GLSVAVEQVEEPFFLGKERAKPSHHGNSCRLRMASSEGLSQYCHRPFSIRARPIAPAGPAHPPLSRIRENGVTGTTLEGLSEVMCNLPTMPGGRSASRTSYRDCSAAARAANWSDGGRI